MRRTALALTLGSLLAGCGGATTHSPTTGNAGTTSSASTTISDHASPPKPAAPVTLRQDGSLGLPSPRSGAAASIYGGRLFVIGGLSAAGTSTATVYALSPSSHAHTTASLPGPVHDAAATVVGGRLLLFGGGQFEGSNRIVQIAPGATHQVGTLPQALSDLEAVTIGHRAYVVGGWNGSATNRDIYAVTPGGHASVAGSIPVGVRYAAVGAIGDEVVVAGGELASGTPTGRAYAFDSRTGRAVGLPDLPVATDHGSGAVIGNTFYVIGGLRDGAFTRAIIAWRPGWRHWRRAGRLGQPIADAAAAVFGRGVALAGGRDPAGKRTGVELLSR